MAYSVWTLVTLAIILGFLGLGLSKKFLGYGSLLLANVAVHFVRFLSPNVPVLFGERVRWIPVIVDDLAIRPDLVFQGDPSIPLRVLGHMFLHADFMHLLGNMFILGIFGFYLEERIGGRKIIAAYLATGLVAALFEVLNVGNHQVIMVGASGADFGLIGILAAAYPRERLRLPIIAFFIIFVRMQAWIAALLAAAFQVVLMTFLAPYDNTAYFAHLGGLTGGLVLGWTVFRHHTPRVAAVAIPTAFANTQEARQALGHMQANHDLPDVYAVWQERFTSAATCPRCQSPPRTAKGRWACPQCNYDGS